MLDNSNIPDFNLIAKYLAGEASAEEIKIIKEWINSGNEEEFEQIKQIWSGAGNNEITFNTEKALGTVNQRIKHSTKRRRIKLFTVAAAAIILIIAIPSIIPRLVSEPTKTELISQSTQEEIKSIQLADGSNVTLNHNSKLTYSEDFKDNRLVKLEGEAYFEVEHIDDQNTFIVETQNVSITVIGTKFNVTSDKENSTVNVSVTEGIVEVKAFEDQDVVRITKGQSIEVNLSSLEYKLDTLGVENDIYWISKEIIFNNSDINEIASTLSSIYGKQFIISLSDPEQYRLTTEFESQNLEEVLSILELTLDISIIKENDSIVFQDAEE